MKDGLCLCSPLRVPIFASSCLIVLLLNGGSQDASWDGGQTVGNESGEGAEGKEEYGRKIKGN